MQEEPMPAQQGRSINWIIKLSKLCNLRCGYCYEWNELGDARRMSDELVERVLQAAEDLHRLRLRTSEAICTTLIMHGGEPLVLPLDYLRSFLDRARSHFSSLKHEIALQSNLFRVTDAQIALLKAYGVGIGVSNDVIPGVRLTIDGKESETRVDENIRRVRDAGLPLAAIVVIGKHTAPNLRQIYDHFAGRGMLMRALPLADGPAERPLEQFSISLEETVAAMCDLFDYWFETGLRAPVDPLRAYVLDAIRFLLDYKARKFDRAKSGDYAFFVNVDGRLYTERDAYDASRALGDLNRESMKEILSASSYAASLDRDAMLVANKCPTCPLDASCRGWPILATKSRADFETPCAVAPAVTLHIARRLETWGFGREELRRMLSGDAPHAKFAVA